MSNTGITQIEIPSELEEAFDRVLAQKIQSGEVKNKEELVKNILTDGLSKLDQTGDGI